MHGSQACLAVATMDVSPGDQYDMVGSRLPRPHKTAGHNLHVQGAH